MIWGGYDESFGRLDDAMMRGFDPDTARLPDNGEPLTPEWQGALDRSIEIVRHLRCGVEDCGERRCDRCDERMTCTGPEPRACSTTCCDCECSCPTCFQVREEMRAELLRKIQEEA